MPDVFVPVGRMERWVDNFVARHGPTDLVVDGGLSGVAADGSTFRALLPFDETYTGQASAAGLAAAAACPSSWGVLLVRKGGFAVARLAGERMVESKVGQRHVQGRTKAGGQSQQRFARRRDNQARQAYEAAAGHAARILAGVPVLVTGGDHAAVSATLAEAGLAARVLETFHVVPDPRRAVLEEVVVHATGLRVHVTNA